MLEIEIESPDLPEIVALLEAGDAFAASLYPAESNHMLDAAALKRPEGTFVAARHDGQIVGCGAVVDSGDGWAEIKRMFVMPLARGQQVGRKLLQKIEAIATERGITLLRLETGIKQLPALSLYRSAGYTDIGPFGRYVSDPLSVFMEKSIGTGTWRQSGHS